MRKKADKSSTQSSENSAPVSEDLKSRKKPLLSDIHAKITTSSALNGGFDTLLYKIDKIEQSQGQLVSKVDKIHEAIYDPDHGIFARISEHKLENEVKLNSIDKCVAELNIWKDTREKEERKEGEVIEKASVKIDSLEKSVETLTKTRETAWGVAKWFLVAIGGGIITLIFGWLESKFK